MSDIVLPIPTMASRSSASCLSTSTSDLEAIDSVEEFVVRGGGGGRDTFWVRFTLEDVGILEN